MSFWYFSKHFFSNFYNLIISVLLTFRKWQRNVQINKVTWHFLKSRLLKEVFGLKEIFKSSSICFYFFFWNYNNKKKTIHNGVQFNILSEFYFKWCIESMGMIIKCIKMLNTFDQGYKYLHTIVFNAYKLIFHEMTIKIVTFHNPNSTKT